MDDYAIVVLPLSEEDGGGFVGIAPDLQGCMSDGDTRDEALRNTELAIGEWLNAQEKRGANIPKPGDASTREQQRQRSLLDAVRAMSEYANHADGRIKDLELALERAIEKLPRWEHNLALLSAAGGSSHVLRRVKH